MISRSSLIAAALAATILVPASASAARVAPDVKQLEMKPVAFKALATGNPVVTSGGALVTFSILNGANVDFIVKAEQAGKRSGGACVPGKPKKTRKKSGACVRTVPVPGTFKLVGIPGENEFRFSGRIGEKALTPGRYRLIAKAEGTAARSSFVRFNIVK